MYFASHGHHFPNIYDHRRRLSVMILQSFRRVSLSAPDVSESVAVQTGAVLYYYVNGCQRGPTPSRNIPKSCEDRKMDAWVGVGVLVRPGACVSAMVILNI